jgi:hypothetical protein
MFLIQNSFASYQSKSAYKHFCMLLLERVRPIIMVLKRNHVTDLVSILLCFSLRFPQYAIG